MANQGFLSYNEEDYILKYFEKRLNKKGGLT